MTNRILCLRSVRLQYGNTVAVDGLCLDVFSGQIFGLLGANGSGKSTTLSAIAGQVAATQGEITIAGMTIATAPLDYRRLFGLVPQALAFYEELSGEENLRFFGRLYGLTGPTLRDRVAETLALVRLTEQARRAARTYSGGMQRRLNLACALLHRPALLLLDEPTVNLDCESREAVFACLRLLRDQGSAIILATHHMDEAEQLCDRVGIMDRGRLRAVGTVAELINPVEGRWRRDPTRPNSCNSRPRLEAPCVSLGTSLEDTC
jgi:ABC-2 type transport system ATP-binding protein